MVYKNKKIGLNKRLIISLVSIILLVVVSIGAAINTVFKEKFAIYISKNNEKEISNLIDLIESEYKNSRWNRYNINEIGKSAISKGRFIEIYDNNNSLVWSAFEYNNKLCHQTMDDIQNNMNNVYPKWSGEYEDKTFNLKDENKNYIGYINIGSYGSFYYMDEEVDFLKEINKVIVAIAIITIIITIIIAIIIANNISKPIERVSNTANVIGNGGYDCKLDYESNIVEIDNLINSINDLSFKLKEQENLRKRLTTDISHELRTPLTNVQTHLEAIIDGIWEPSIERLNSVNEEVIRLTNLVNQLSNLAKFDSDKSTLTLSKVSLEELLKNIVYNNQGKALEKNININFEIEDIDAYIDKEKISQLINNLLSNAIRYSDYNGEIDILAYKVDNSIKIHFKDNGIGIPSEDIDHIFERFYRVDESRSKNTGGIGVGLTISKSIVELHKGKIDVKSKVNQGSEFIVTLPLINKF